jgi:hypothetical protein
VTSARVRAVKPKFAAASRADEKARTALRAKVGMAVRKVPALAVDDNYSRAAHATASRSSRSSHADSAQPGASICASRAGYDGHESDCRQRRHTPSA